MHLLIRHHACIGDPFPEDPVEEEPQEEGAVEPSDDVQGMPLSIPMLYNCIMNYIIYCIAMLLYD
jgi:hypothetical protein